MIILRQQIKEQESMEKHGFWGKRKNGESDMFLKKHGENLESDPKAKKRNKWLLRIGIGVAVLGACFTVLDKGTALRLMMNPNVKKIIWMPGWSFGVDQDNEWVESVCYGLGEIIFGDRTYGKDGKKIDRGVTRRCMDTDMTAVFNERKQTVTFYDRDGKEQETIHLDGENISRIGWGIHFESGLIPVYMKNDERKILNFRTNQVYDDNNPYNPYSIEDDISDGYIRVRKNGLYGYLDINGNERIAPKYDRAGLFKNGLAKVQKADGSWVLIDKNDTEIYFEGLTNDLYDYDDRLIRVKDGFVDHEGNYVVRLEEYGEDVSTQLLFHSRILVEGEEMICVLNAKGTEVYHSGKTLDGDYIYDGFEENRNGNVLLKYYMDPDNPDDSNGKYTILSQSGKPIVEYADRAEGGYSMKYVDGNEWIAVFKDDRLVPTGIEGDLDVWEYGETTQDWHPLVLRTQDSTHIFSESGEKFVMEGAHDELEYYEGEGGEIFVAGTYKSPSGLYSSKKGQILPAGCRVEMASPQLLCVENTLLGRGWAYVVVLK